jgi:hypothetical protein|tara:strand:+ start:846 stop:956 length:111 start_codon:yes stop_codon:yes gene_type:complete
MGASFEDLKELIQKLKSISKNTQGAVLLNKKPLTVN